MVKKQRDAASAIIKAFNEHCDEKGGVPNETYISPTTNLVMQNACFVDVRWLKQLAGIATDADLADLKKGR